MPRLSNEEFLEKVKEKFGDKIRVDQLKTKEEDAAKLKLTKKEIEGYPAQAWLIYKNEDGYELCPNCDEPLFGLFGSFQWEIAHGCGFCTKCKKVGFRYYHYIGKPEKRVRLLSVSSF